MELRRHFSKLHEIFQLQGPTILHAVKRKCFQEKGGSLQNHNHNVFTFLDMLLLFICDKTYFLMNRPISVDCVVTRAGTMLDDFDLP